MALLTPEQAAAHLGIGVDTLGAMRRAGELRYVNIGRGTKRETPRYDPSDLDEWLQRQKVTARPQCPSTSAPTPRTRSTATTSSSVVADFRAARERLLGRKR